MITGFAFHCHHSQLLEFVYDYDGRIRAIQEIKPQSEIPLRLKLFQMIPEERLPKRGLAAVEKARDAYDKAWEAYVKAREKARNAYYKAHDAYIKAHDAYFKNNEKAFLKLHEELCPNCPWNGKTIFTRQDKDGNWY